MPKYYKWLRMLGLYETGKVIFFVGLFTIYRQQEATDRFIKKGV